MITRQQIEILKNELKEIKQMRENQLKRNKEGSLEGDNSRETVGELSLYDNHPADMGTELFEREKDFALEEHADSELDKIKAALNAMEMGTYGKCTICDVDIPFERLKAIPTTLYCKKHSPEQIIPSDRPSEENVLEPAHNNFFQHRQNREVFDHEDSFQEVARFGTSETPSDLAGDYESYESLYNESHDDEGFTEDIETFLATDMTGTKIEVYPSKKHEEYEASLDKENIESIIGNIPYKQKDGYVDNKNKPFSKGK
ncbi:TraR/DksA C4-type zinc finger protein [Bacillus aquiflavi]|uniref:Molecular chaperone DnaK n=1 Tax=Bacillus aquiflavi TaxID=2672567 RepID=A0A6B3VZH5_9BACI|nr:TraR/DksA C4-type zinc finger protein [Bacillus aquiflavi]MBA4537402.1 TraR/DksA C4-type zinc finger protein [Bacillus aquiflavi]NEY81657.1 molecular chaperone DnaK [Bacillus aquiflavi]UAC47653.1 TraR/DksA C4-type zinc finger protein [Bacillus aquiflavi]